MSSVVRPLDGALVVALEQAVAAPFATRQLADLGARVIKVERLDGGDFARAYDTAVRGSSSQFVWLNRSKESLTLDLKRPEAKGILHSLLAEADVFIQNLAPGAAERLGLPSEALRQRYPQLIICNISGYGPGGPWTDKKAYDLLVQAEAGLLTITGTPDEPCRAGISVADIAAGMYALSGILAALLQRERTGEGTVVEVSLFDALVEWMSYPMYFAAHGGAPLPRTGAHHATISPYGPFAAGDGQTIFLAVQNAREWSAFCTLVLEQPELERDPRFRSNPDRVSHRTALEEILTGVFGQLTSKQLQERLDRAQIAYARLNSADEVWNHPQLLARGRLSTIGSPVGEISVIQPPIGISGSEPYLGNVPDLGEHTNEILQSLGYTQTEIEELRQKRVM